MRVVMDVTPLAQHRGMGRYVREIVREFVRMGISLRGSVRMGRPIRGDVLRYVRNARAEGISVIPGFLLTTPMASRWGEIYHAVEPSSWMAPRIPGVVTFHDFAQFRSGSPRFQKILRRLQEHPPKRVIAVSSFTANETERVLPVLRGRIRVVYHGVRPLYRLRGPEEVRDLLNTLNLKWKGYFLFAGEADDRKNLSVLSPVVQDSTLPPLVVVGARPERLARYLALDAPGLWLLPPQPEEILAGLYAGALALLFPSREEGFGFPVLEAMASGTLVLTTPCSAIPEVGGDVPLYLPPDNPDAWWEKAREVARDPEVHRDRVEKGILRAQTFSWEKTARKTLEVYREALEKTG